MVQVFLKFGSAPSFSQLSASGSFSQSSASAPDALGPQHIPDIVEFLVDFAHKWRCIGTALRFQPQDLDCIQASPLLIADAPEAFLRKIIEDWIQRRFKHTQEPRVSVLERVLNSRTVGLGVVGDKVRNYVSLLPNRGHENPPFVCFTLKFKEKQANAGYFIEPFEVIDNPISSEIECMSNIRKFLCVEEGKAILLETKIPFKGPCNYQWLANGLALKDNESFSGATGPLLCITKASLEMDGLKVSCTVTTKYLQDSITTATITLKVDCELDDFLSSLSLLYLSKPEVPEDTWPPVSSSKYINLALIKQEQPNCNTDFAHQTIRGNMDDIVQHKEKIDFNELVTGITIGQILFIEGRPGSGKTTFVNKITRRWASSSGPIRLLLLVSLRVLNDLNKRKLNLNDILKLFKDLKVSRELIEKRNGKGVCFIFDGLDEFSPRDGKKSLVNKIINKEYLNQSTVIVASRQQ
jgi:hypothetical protein